MNNIELRKVWGTKLLSYGKHKDHDVFNQSESYNTIFKTNHSLQLNRMGFSLLHKSKIPIQTIAIKTNKSVHHLLSISKIMDAPYYFQEHHISSELKLFTIESDKTTMLIMMEGNIESWTKMYID